MDRNRFLSSGSAAPAPGAATAEAGGRAQQQLLLDAQLRQLQQLIGGGAAPSGARTLLSGAASAADTATNLPLAPADPHALLVPSAAGLLNVGNAGVVGPGSGTGPAAVSSSSAPAFASSAPSFASLSSLASASAFSSPAIAPDFGEDILRDAGLPSAAGRFSASNKRKGGGGDSPPSFAAASTASLSRHPRRKKPKDMPKRPLSAYNLFFRDVRIEILEKRDEDFDAGQGASSSASQGDRGEGEQGAREEECGPPKKKRNAAFEGLAKTVARRWKALGPDERERYASLAEAEWERYRAEMEEYNRGADDRRAAREKAEAKASAEDKVRRRQAADSLRRDINSARERVEAVEGQAKRGSPAAAIGASGTGTGAGSIAANGSDPAAAAIAGPDAKPSHLSLRGAIQVASASAVVDVSDGGSNTLAAVAAANVSSEAKPPEPVTHSSVGLVVNPQQVLQQLSGNSVTPQGNNTLTPDAVAALAGLQAPNPCPAIDQARLAMFLAAPQGAVAESALATNGSGNGNGNGNSAVATLLVQQLQQQRQQSQQQQQLLQQQLLQQQTAQQQQQSAAATAATLGSLLAAASGRPAPLAAASARPAPLSAAGALGVGEQHQPQQPLAQQLAAVLQAATAAPAPPPAVGVGGVVGLDVDAAQQLLLQAALLQQQQQQRQGGGRGWPPG